MANNRADKILEKFSTECIQCGICINTCSLLEKVGLTPGEIADMVLQGTSDEDTVRAIQCCALCGKCGEDCLVNLNPSEMMKAAREMLIQQGKINPEDYDVMLVDRDWNFFSIYNATYGVRYDDLAVEACEVIFFPGCTLASYSPELTRATYNWLKQNGMQVGFTDLCCGKPLDSIGMTKEADRYLDRLRAQIQNSGAKKIITSCPNCETTLRHHLPGIEIVSIFPLLIEAGFQLDGDQVVTFHDSCPDRYDIKNPTAVRKLFAGFEQKEMASHGKNTICCGSGGIVSMIDPDLCAERAQIRMAEFTDTGADVCITSCMACAHRLGRASEPGKVRHCLEYIFNIPVDYEQVEKNTYAMWQGEAGQLNLTRLLQAGDSHVE